MSRALLFIIPGFLVFACRGDVPSPPQGATGGQGGVSSGGGGGAAGSSSGSGGPSTGGSFGGGGATPDSGSPGGAAGLTSSGASGAAGSGGNAGNAGTGGNAGSGGGGEGGIGGATVDGGPPFAHFCDLPGSVQSTAQGLVTVAGGVGAGVVAFMHLPVGFCAHFFGNIGNTRQLRFAPNGDLFVASPTRGTTGGGPRGTNSILVLPDDDGDGVADGVLTYITGLPSAQGMMFASDSFYYQTDPPTNCMQSGGCPASRIMRVPYAMGDRTPSGAAQLVLDTSKYNSSGLHWPKPMDQADDGTIYVGNGSDQGEVCDTSRPFVGGILQLDGTANGKPISKGFRNPIAIRCQRGHNRCFAIELSKDYSIAEGGREKLVPIREGDDWGFPCCATKNLPYNDIMQHPDCSSITPEDVSFLIGDTPFGLDFERGKWPAPYTGSAFIPLHGQAGSWFGARIVAIAVDPATGLPKPGSSADAGVSEGSMTDFATGWDDAKSPRMHGRPAAIEFAPDGRMFVGNDNDGNIIWVAPLDLPRPSPRASR